MTDNNVGPKHNNDESIENSNYPKHVHVLLGSVGISLQKRLGRFANDQDQYVLVLKAGNVHTEIANNYPSEYKALQGLFDMLDELLNGIVDTDEIEEDENYKRLNDWKVCLDEKTDSSFIHVISDLVGSLCDEENRTFSTPPCREGCILAHGQVRFGA